MKVAIVGTRTFTDFQLMRDKVTEYIHPSSITEIISGGATGADRLAEKFALCYGIPIQIFHPDWNTHGKVAGVLRNKKIVDKADLIIAFWNGSSRGTANTINIARQLKKDLLVIHI